MKASGEAGFATMETESGARILIVDDDPVVAGMLGVTLAASGKL